jgi:hypothetical protein
MNHIQEFQAPNFHGAAERCFLALILAVVFGLAVSRRRMALREALILLFAVYAGLFASRNLPTSALLITVLIAPLWSRIFRDRIGKVGAGTSIGRFSELEERVGQTDATLHPGAWMFIGLLLAVGGASRGGTLGPIPMQARFEPTRFPVAAVDFLKSQERLVPVFSTDQWGGYLAFRLFPAKVMVDDRHDLYGTPFFKRYLKIVQVQPGWLRELEAMNAQTVLVPSNSSLAGALESTPGWEIEYHDDTAVLFRQTQAAFQ